MRLRTNPLIPGAHINLLAELRDHAAKVNLLADGRLAAIDNAQPAAPTSGDHAQGDFVRNRAPTEAGIVGAKYVVFGWLCVASGSPGTWVDCRFLTGN